MATTTLSNMVNPEVMADMITASLPNKIKFAPLATIDTTLVGTPGSTITVPKYAFIGEAEDMAEGVAIGTVVLTASTVNATVKKVGKAVDVTDESVLSGYGDPIGQCNSQLGDAVALKVDSDCVTALNGASLLFDGATAKISYAGIVDAVDKFGDEDDEAKVLFISPSQLTTLRKDPNFLDMNKYPVAVIMTGVIGSIAGCQVVVAKKIVAGATTVADLIVKANALTIYMKRGIAVETARDIKAKTTTIVIDQHYVAVLSDASKVVKATFLK